MVKRASIDLAAIYTPVAADLERVEEMLQVEGQVDYGPIADLIAYGLKSHGKRIRPALTLFAGKFFEHDSKRLLCMATAVELLHTATLIHDDAIDNSVVRRGRATVYKVWGPEKAILLGDYLFAQAGAMTARTGNLRAIRLFAETLKTISIGELNQSFNAFNLKQELKDYIDRMACKTASLFCMATESGAAMSEAPEPAIQSLISYAYDLGIAFQIIDDVLDFTATEKELGKPVGSDLVQGTLTLPAMLILRNHPGDNPVQRLFEKQPRPDDIKLAIEMAREPEIVDECYRLATDYSEKAAAAIGGLPEGDAKRALLDLASYLTLRDK